MVFLIYARNPQLISLKPHEWSKRFYFYRCPEKRVRLARLSYW